MKRLISALAGTMSLAASAMAADKVTCSSNGDAVAARGYYVAKAKGFYDEERARRRHQAGRPDIAPEQIIAVAAPM
jgi:NitT/TauT family transport system substrate-binding protein